MPAKIIDLARWKLEHPRLTIASPWYFWGSLWAQWIGFWLPR